MKRIFDRQQMREYWQKVYHSLHHKMSRGAEYITRTISWARGDNWRRNDKNNKK